MEKQGSLLGVVSIFEHIKCKKCQILSFISWE